MVTPTFTHHSGRRGRAATHRPMAMAALASNCSLSVRYRRYHAHMLMAGALSRAAAAVTPEAVREVGE